MIIDLNSFIGPWPSHPVSGEPKEVWSSLRTVGVTRIFTSHLSAVWCRNPHVYNDVLFDVVEAVDDVWPVPVLDPTVADWRPELEKISAHDRVKVVRLFPNYGGYELADVGDFLRAIQETNLAVIVQTCLEDPRRQHPRAVVSSVAASAVVDMANDFPDLRVVIGGAKAGDLRNLSDRILTLPNLYADTAHVDGLDAIKLLVDVGLGERLVLGSHAPLFIPHAAMGRVVTDIEGDVVSKILEHNALRFLRES